MCVSRKQIESKCQESQSASERAKVEPDAIRRPREGEERKKEKKKERKHEYIY